MFEATIASENYDNLWHVVRSHKLSVSFLGLTSVVCLAFN